MVLPRGSGGAEATAGLAGPLQVRDLVLHGRGHLLQPVAQLHPLGGAVLLQSGDDLSEAQRRPSGDPSGPLGRFAADFSGLLGPWGTARAPHYFPCGLRAASVGGKAIPRVATTGF